MGKRTVTIKLDEKLYLRLHHEAERRRTTKSCVLREAFEQSLEHAPGDSLLGQIEDLLGSEPTAPKDLSTNKKYLKGYGQ